MRPTVTPRSARIPVALAALALSMLASPAHASSPLAFPADGATQVDRIVPPHLRFGSLQDATSAAPGRLGLRTPIGTLVAGLVRISGDATTFVPTAPLDGCTTYALQLDHGLQQAPQRSRFTTACST